MGLTTRQTDRAGRVFRIADREAVALTRRHLGTEFLLLGLAQEENEHDGGTGLLTSRGLDASLLRDDIRRHRGPAAVPDGDASRPLSARAKAALGHACRISDDLPDQAVGVRHLLLGVLADRECGAVRTLQRLDVDVDDVAADGWNRIGDDVGPRTYASVSPVLPQLTAIMRMIGQLHARFDAIEARLDRGGLR